MPLSRYIINSFKRSLTPIITIGFKSASSLLSYAMFFTASVKLSPSEFGIFSIVFSVTTIASTLSLFGQANFLLRQSPHFSPNINISLLKFSYTIFLVSTGFTSVLLYAYSLYSDILVEKKTLIVFFLLFSITELQSYKIRSFGYPILSTIPKEILWRTSVILSFYVSPSSPIVSDIFATISITLFFSAVIQICFEYVLVHYRPLVKSRVNAQQHLKECSIYWASSLLGISTQTLSVIIVGYSLSYQDAGFLFLIQKLSMIITLPLLGTGTHYAHKIASLYYQKKVEKIKYDLRQLAILTSVIGTFLFTCVLYFILHHGEIIDYPATQNITPLIILCAAQLFNVLCGPVGFVLCMTKHHITFLKIQFISESVGVATLLLLTDTYGITGASIALATSIIISNTLSIIRIKRDVL